MKWVASLGGVGFLPGPAGTYGSILALPLVWLVHTYTDPFFLLNLIVFLFLTGYITADRATRGSSEKDPGWIIIDELVGMMIALWPVSYGAARAEADILALWPGWVAAFVLFRLFDIWKPGPVGWADRMPGALGVMLDDGIAGVMAAVGVGALAALFHLVLM